MQILPQVLLLILPASRGYPLHPDRRHLAYFDTPSISQLNNHHVWIETRLFLAARLLISATMDSLVFLNIKESRTNGI